MNRESRWRDLKNAKNRLVEGLDNEAVRRQAAEAARRAASLGDRGARRLSELGERIETGPPSEPRAVGDTIGASPESTGHGDTPPSSTSLDPNEYVESIAAVRAESQDLAARKSAVLSAFVAVLKDNEIAPNTKIGRKRDKQPAWILSTRGFTFKEIVHGNSVTSPDAEQTMVAVDGTYCRRTVRKGETRLGRAPAGVELEELVIELSHYLQTHDLRWPDGFQV